MSRVVAKATVVYVQTRAHFLCEYCKIPNPFGFARFEIDHIIAKAHRGTDELNNLAWSCLTCNSNKGPNLSSIDPESGRLARLFHPRVDKWPLHFQLSEGLIVAKTAQGRATISLLKMNVRQTFILRRTLEQIETGYAELVKRRCV